MKQKSHYNQSGYRLIYMPEHERADMNGYVLEHIVMWEEANNRKIPEGFVVHHINRKRDDNTPSNLQVMSKAEHIALHHSGAKRTEQTKQKLSEWAKARLANKENHPQYKNIDIRTLQEEVQSGATVKSVCQKYGICRYTYYKKLKEITK